MQKTFDWTKFPRTDLYNQIVVEWERLLENTELKESAYHAFLQKTPAIFFTLIDSYLVVSKLKLKLGSEYETDFVIVEEGYSNGTVYELVEIESPHTDLFDRSGKPTSKFNSALQQIRDWKRYLINNKNDIKKIFPTASTKVVKDSKLRFKIVIGRRNDNQEHIEKRKQIEEQENIEIVSFDRLTDLARNRRYFSDVAQIYAPQMDSQAYELRNELANPFYECINDSKWRSICRKGHSHIYSNMIEDILKVRTYNEYLEEYKKWLTKDK